jgi:hypothetical protein
LGCEGWKTNEKVKKTLATSSTAHVTQAQLSRKIWAQTCTSGNASARAWRPSKAVEAKGKSFVDARDDMVSAPTDLVTARGGAIAFLCPALQNGTDIE